MKQVLVLEQADLARLRHGELLQLTPQLSLSLLTIRRRAAHDGQVTTKVLLGEEERRRRKNAYSRKWRKEHPSYYSTARRAQAIHCPSCRRTFNSKQALGAHKAHCSKTPE